MHIPRTTLLLALSLAALPTPASAERLTEPTSKRYPGPPEEAARAFLADHGRALGTDGIDLVVQNVLHFAGFSTVRLTQRHHGLPVHDRLVAVRLAPDGQVRYAETDVARDIDVRLTPTVDEAAARRSVSTLLRRDIGSDFPAELGISTRWRRAGLLVWRIDTMTLHGMRRHVVDAHSGRVLEVYPLARDVKGRVFDVNWRKSAKTADRDLLDLVPPESGPQTLQGRAGTVYHFVSGDIERNPASLKLDQLAAPDAKGNFLYEPEAQPSAAMAYKTNDPFAEVNTYYHIERMDKYFRETLKEKMGYALSVIVNYSPGGRPYDNAFFTPWSVSKGTIFIGQGSSSDLAYDSDVFLHEFTHFVNNRAIGFDQGMLDEYGVATMPGALDEGTADYFSSTVNDDSVVGEAALGQGARDLDGDSGTCPDTLYGESHEDGKLIGTSAWSIRKELGAAVGDQLIWSATHLLKPSSSLGDFGRYVRLGLKDLQSAGKVTDEKVQNVEAILAARGLDDCDRTLEITPRQFRRTNIIGMDMMGMYFGAGCQDLTDYGVVLTSLFQFRYTPKTTDERVKFTVDLSKLWGGNALDWSIYVRRGFPVTFSGSDYAIEPDEVDYKVEHLTGKHGEIVIDAATAPPFSTEKPYYMVIAHQNCPVMKATISVEAAAAAADAGAGDAGSGDGGSARDGGRRDAGRDGGTLPSLSGGGCACSVGARDAGAPALGLLLVGAIALTLARRRRPR